MQYQDSNLKKRSTHLSTYNKSLNFGSGALKCGPPPVSNSFGENDEIEYGYQDRDVVR